MSLRALQLALIPVLSLLCACASAPTPIKNAQNYFTEGEAAYASGNYGEAIARWKKVKESYSSPELTTQAELKIADAHFEDESFIEAVAAYEDFRKLHPSHPKAEYALYRLGLSHYFQVAGTDRDQTPVKNAVLTLDGFLRLYPDSAHAAEVKQKLADCRIKQLAYENYVGRFYLKTGKYPSAIKRLQEALIRFPQTPKLDETLFYLGKAHLEFGDAAKAKSVFQRLTVEYPDSPLSRDAEKLLEKLAV